MRQVLTIMTCDRCGKEQRFDNTEGDFDPHEVREFQADWASEWPATVAPYGWYPYRGHSTRHVCEGCLTDAEREEIVMHREQADEIPF
jgi:hypothetical protein